MLLDLIHLRKDIIFIKPSCSESKDLIEEIRKVIVKENCSNIILDLTKLNFFNSIRVGVLVATYHFIEFINGKIYVVVHDEQVKRYIDTLNFNNTVVIYNKKSLILNNIAYII